MQISSRWNNWQKSLVLPPADWRSRIMLGGQTLLIQSWGNGEPLVVVPGMAGGLPLLAPLIRELSQEFKVIGIEMREEHRLVGFRRPYGLGDLADDLVAVMDSLHLENPRVLGVSFGAVLAMETAIRHPGRIQQLIIQGVGSHFENGLIPRVANMVLPHFPLPNNMPGINQFFNLLFGKNWPDRALVNAVIRQCWQTDQGVISERFDLVRQFDWRHRLSNVFLPILALRGENDVLVSRSCLSDLKIRLPYGIHKEIEGAGHLAFATHPVEFSRLVREFTCYLAQSAA